MMLLGNIVCKKALLGGSNAIVYRVIEYSPIVNDDPNQRY